MCNCRLEGEDHVEWSEYKIKGSSTRAGPAKLSCNGGGGGGQQMVCECVCVATTLTLSLPSSCMVFVLEGNDGDGGSSDVAYTSDDTGGVRVEGGDERRCRRERVCDYYPSIFKSMLEERAGLHWSLVVCVQLATGINTHTICLLFSGGIVGTG